MRLSNRRALCNFSDLAAACDVLARKRLAACRFRRGSFVASVEPNEETPMRFMMFVKASPESEKGVMPTEQQLAEMARFNESMVKAGVMLSGEGLHPSSKGAIIKYSGAKRTIVDGPFSEAKELVAGYWIIQVKSREEALEWCKRVPFQDGEVELRQVFELEDFAQGPAIEHHRQLQKELDHEN
jgi:hypothetical protein